MQWHFFAGERLNANVLVPELRVFGDEVAHHLDAFFVLQDFDFDAVFAEVFFVTHEGFIFADDYFWNAIEQNCAGTHGAGRKGCVNDTLFVDRSFEASGIFKGVHFAVMNDRAVLNALVVAAPDYFTIAHQNRANGNSASGQTFFRFVDRCSQEWIHSSDIVGQQEPSL
jgi:hypothetical protein